ncbi:MAG: ASKHA domain-containing protein [Thermoguttaceae bacterium]
MRETEVSVAFQSPEKTVYVLRGTKLLEAAALADLVLNSSCGGEGLCGKCRVVVAAGAGEPTAEEKQFFSAAELHSGCRLACRCTVDGPMSVVVPQPSLLGARGQILVHSEGTVAAEVDPVVRKRYVELPLPARGDDDADLARLEKAVGPLEIDLDLLRGLPRRLRESGFRGTAVLADGRLLDFEPGNTEWNACAVAVDVGTTTLAAALLDANSGRDLAVAARLNPQTRFGDDVVSRILRTRTDSDGLRQLQAAITAAVDEMIGELCRAADVPREQVYEITVAGNTTMQQLFCGLDPGALGEMPFVPVAGRSLLAPAVELGLHVHPRGRVWVLPVIGGFVGGDTVAGVLATGLAEAQQPTLFVDIGTNGELVLVSEGRLSAASTAAGPAFEGARIMHGMRGTAGAIEKVLLVDGELRINVIGDVPPAGLCGSALIDAAAELLRHGILSPQGRMALPGELPAGVPPDLARRIVLYENQPALELAAAGETAGGGPILLTQRDLRELQLATGAIRAGITLLLRRHGLKPCELDRVLVGGGFGNFIRRSNAQRIGLLPWRLEHRRIRYQGNTSLAGARLAAVSRRARAAADELARRIEHVDLSRDPDFATTFADAMIFPGGE